MVLSNILRIIRFASWQSGRPFTFSFIWFSLLYVWLLFLFYLLINIIFSWRSESFLCTCDRCHRLDSWLGEFIQPKICYWISSESTFGPAYLNMWKVFSHDYCGKDRFFVDNLNCLWHPFASKNDFELAEHILCTCLNGEGRDGFFKVLKTQAGDHPSAFTINNDHTLKEAWSKAENLLTKVCFYIIFLYFRYQLIIKFSLKKKHWL